MRRWLLGLVLLPGLASGQMVAQMVARDGVVLSQAQENRAEAIGAQLRCLVCQNESIEGSSAGLAKQLRVIIRQQVIAGASNRAVMDYMVRRYGIFVLLEPPLTRLTWLLYASPLLALGLGGAAAWAARRRRPAAPAALSAAERARLDELLR